MAETKALKTMWSKTMKLVMSGLGNLLAWLLVLAGIGFCIWIGTLE